MKGVKANFLYFQPNAISSGFNLTTLRNTLNRYLYAQETGEDLMDMEESMSDDDIALQMALQDTFDNSEQPQEESPSSQESSSGQ